MQKPGISPDRQEVKPLPLPQVEAEMDRREDTEAGEKAGRKELTIKVLQRRGLIVEGTPIELLPDAILPDSRNQDPKVFQAHFKNLRSKKSVIWEYDSNAYSLTELSTKLENTV